MANYLPLALDGAPFRILHKLYLADDQSATLAQLEKILMNLVGSAAGFRKFVLEPLIRRDFIALKRHSLFQITDAGRRAIEVYPSLVPATASKNDPAPLTSFSFVAFYSNIPNRPGAFDYRDIPSLIGDERVPYRWKNVEA
jgi:hypothetical protein